MDRSYNIKQLKAFYENVCATHLGNGYKGLSAQASLDHEMLSAVLSTIEPDPTTSRTHIAKSPWEAAIYLMDQQSRTFENDKLCTVFRGQKFGYGNIRPSAWRAHPVLSERQVDDWRGVFCLLVKVTTEKNIRLSVPAKIYQTAGQHYHIPTELLDLSIDPTISTWFANEGVKPFEKADGEVFFFSLEDEQQTEVILPPPYVTRLYRQRGIFHFTTSRAENEALFNRCNRIRFSRCPGFLPGKKYPFYRPNQFYGPNQYYRDLRIEAKKIALELPVDFFEWLYSDTNLENTKQRMEEVKSKYFANALTYIESKYSFPREWWEEKLKEWVENTNDYFRWLNIGNSSDPSDPNSTISKIIERNERSLFWYTLWYLEMNRGTAQDKKAWVTKLQNELFKRHPHLQQQGR